MNLPPAPTSCPAPFRLVLGVTGSIAAYKAADLVSRLVQAGLEVQVIMTANATKLVQPQTFMTLSRQRVTTDLWEVPDWRPEHIALADQADLLAIVPATANLLGKLANGIADDALSTFALSYLGPVLVAPAMNPRMWRHPAVRDNCARLAARGVRFVGPDPGRVACGDEAGPGRLAPVERILNAILATAAQLRNPHRATPPRQVLVTAGPTREFLDPARYLANRSSGKMGYALAEVAAAAGHAVTLISGPVELPIPANCTVVPVTSAAEMAAAVRQQFPACDLLLMCGAVADYRPKVVSATKFKKQPGPKTIEFERTDDILSTLPEKRPGQIVVGFAAETDHIEEYARGKLAAKHLDWIVANDIGRPDIGFQADVNEVTLYGADGSRQPLPLASKLEIAAQLLQAILGPPRPAN